MQHGLKHNSTKVFVWPAVGSCSDLFATSKKTRNDQESAVADRHPALGRAELCMSHDNMRFHHEHVCSHSTILRSFACMITELCCLQGKKRKSGH